MVCLCVFFVSLISATSVYHTLCYSFPLAPYLAHHLFHLHASPAGVEGGHLSVLSQSPLSLPTLSYSTFCRLVLTSPIISLSVSASDRAALCLGPLAPAAVAQLFLCCS